MSDDSQTPAQDSALLLDTLSNIWQNYAKAAGEQCEDGPDKQHWLEQFLFHFQYVNEETSEREEFKSFFNPIPEELCSYLLEKVYEIISKSELYSPPASLDLLDKFNDEESPGKKANISTLLKTNHNFAELILNNPSDCSKIVALRTFLTHQLGQHLLIFLNKVDINLIASQKSLCNLCINLFPNCPWGDSYTPLAGRATIWDYIGNLKPFILTPDSLASASSNKGASPHSVQAYAEAFDSFKHANKSSDEIAWLLIQMLTKCIVNECETALTEQSMSVIVLNFALDCLNVQDKTFLSARNAGIIKCEFLRLIERCLNNAFANDESISAVQFQCVLAKLVRALQNLRADGVKLQFEGVNIETECAEMTKMEPGCSTSDTTNFELSCAINFIIFAIIHNVVAICNKQNNVLRSKYNLYTMKFIDRNIFDISIKSLQRLARPSSSTDQQSKAPAENDNSVQLLLTNSFKLLLKIIDHLMVYDHLLLNGGLVNGLQQQKPRRKKFVSRQMHCGMQMPALTCYFQGILLSFWPNLRLDLQEATVRYLLRSGTCCCHYTLGTYKTCLDVIPTLAPQYQKYVYKFLYRKILNTVFVRHGADASKKQASYCNCCDTKMKSPDFHKGMLQLYRQLYEQLYKADDHLALIAFLKHLKHISHLLTNNIASGILAEIVLPIFRHYKGKAVSLRRVSTASTITTAVHESKGFWRTAPTTPNFSRHNSSDWDNGNISAPPTFARSSPSTPISPAAPPLDTASSRLNIRFQYQTSHTEDTHSIVLNTVQECLNVFVVYLGDIRLIKAFYNEENISHLEDLLSEPELIRGIGDLMKIGIDNISFLGDNSQEQTALSRRLITLQLNSSDYAAQLFKQLLVRFAKSSKSLQHLFWLEADDLKVSRSVAQPGNLSPVDILHITALQWSLNYELLKTSQYFYNEFAKIYSIVVEDDEDDNSAESNESAPRKEPTRRCNYLKRGDKTIIDILKLNFNALSAFLIPPLAASDGKRDEPQMPTQPYNFTWQADEKYDKANDCASSSLETLVSSLDCSAAQSFHSSISATATSIDGDSYDSITQFYAAQQTNETFLRKLQELETLNRQRNQVVLFDIRHQSQSRDSRVTNATPAISSAGDGLLSALSALHDPQTRAANATVVVAPSNEGILAKLFSMFGSLFASNLSNSSNDLSDRHGNDAEVDADFLCFYAPNGEYKKLLLKLFEATMAICIKGYHNEEVEKMQKHLRKLKALIIRSATEPGDWQPQQHGSDKQSRESAVLQTLNTLLKIAELSNTSLNEAATGQQSSSILTTCTDDASAFPLTLRPPRHGLHLHGKGHVITPPTPPHRPLSGQSVDADYFSTRASTICPDSEFELSGDDNEDYYLTADEGYEADGEIPEVPDSEAEMDTGHMWNSFHPASRYRTNVLHDGLCSLVVEILMELSKLCTQNPVGWSDSLAQLANRLFSIRDYLGGPLFLLKGFTPVLQCNDNRLKDLQQSILELIVDLNTPDVLSTYYSIFVSKQPPVDILMKNMSYICASSLKKVQPTVELEFPTIIDGKCVSTSDPNITEHIENIRNYHLLCQVSTPFTRSPCVIPITHNRLWGNDGFTVSLWLQVKGAQMHKSTSQSLGDDTRSSSECYMKSHILSVGTNQVMLSIYMNSNMNLVFETCRPNGKMHAPPAANDVYEGNTNSNAPSNTQASKIHRKTSNTTNKDAVSPTSSQNANIPAGPSPFRNALKHTKLVFLNSFSNMHLFNGHAEDESYYEGTSVELKYYRFAKNKWSHLACAVDALPDRLELVIYVDGLEQHAISLPFRNLRALTRTHNFQLISIGDGVSAKTAHNTSNYTESRSTLEGQPMHFSISNLLLFNRQITVKEAMLNLAAMGPDFSELTQCQIANWKPNYGYLNISKMASANFGNFMESLKLLKDGRILCYTAQQPDQAMAYIPEAETDGGVYGHHCGIVLYGELLQNQLQSFQTATILCGGLSSLIYLFARVVETTNNSVSQSLALDLLLSVALSDSKLYAEFVHNDYINLVSYVIKSDRCCKDVNLLKSIVNNACNQPLITKKGDSLHAHENTIASLVYPRLLVAVLHRYADWQRSCAENSEVLDMLFQCILALTREKHPHRDFNMQQLNKAGLMKEMLNLCKVYVIESPNPVFISKSAATSFVSIISVFAGSPPSPSLMDEIMKLLLLLHKPSECFITHDRTKFYFLLTPQLPTKEKSSAVTNLSRITTSFRINSARNRPPGVAVALPVKAVPPVNAPDEENRVARIKRLQKLHARSSPYKRPLSDFEDQLENNADCTRLNRGVLRALSPNAVSGWRLKYKRRMSFSSRPGSPVGGKARRSPAESAVYIPRLIAQNKVLRKRHRSPGVMPGSSKQDGSALYSENSAHTLTASLTNSFGFDYKESPLGSVYSSTPLHRGSKVLTKSDFYSALGIMVLQEGLLKLLTDFLCILPDNAIEEVQHYIKVEFLLVLANHSSTAVRASIIRLLTALTKRLPASSLSSYSKQIYPYHLANQLTIHPTDANMFEACIEWVNGICGNMTTLLNYDALLIQNSFGLNSLLAIAARIVNSPQSELGAKTFIILRKTYVTHNQENLAMIEAGLLQCSMKALYTLYIKPNLLNLKTEDAILELLSTIGEKSIKTVGHINILWDILNMFSFYQEKQPTAVIKAFRAAQARLQLNWIDKFYGPVDKTWRFKAMQPPDSTVTAAEFRTRLEMLIDRCTQFFTIFDANYSPSDNEIKLFEYLVSYGISTNLRCHNFIAWGLLPSRSRDLRAYIVDSLWISIRDDFMPSIFCDGKMIKSLLWLCLLEDMDEPIENLELLCKRLGITEYDTAWNLANELERIELNRCNVNAKQKSLLEKTVFKFEMLAVSCIESSMVTTRLVAELQVGCNSERKLLINHMKDYDETFTYAKWLEIIRRMSHEGAPWHSKQNCETSWELDDTEGPSRVHTRLRRCHLEINKRFFMDDYSAPQNAAANATRCDDYVRPLDYLTATYNQQLNISLNSQILYNFPAKYLPVDGEIDGEIIVTDQKLYFMATYHCKYFYITCDIVNITEIWLKRYQHQEKAFEIFLDTNKSLFFSLQNQDDWKIMRDVFSDKIVTPPDQSKVLLITQQWRDGLLTNWEYLMTLNQIAGRTYNDLMQYPVFPWILSNYKSDMLDLTEEQNFRKLNKPIAVQHPENEQHYINNYTYINNTLTNMGSLILKPYHYSSHYSNSGTVLHFLVRVPPFTSYFLRYQDNNFDLPDRTFHALSTTWSLASRDSPTDVKELIPEFFCLPEMFENFERFNFGCRQSGERVEDVALPNWCLRDPRLFVLIHRQALESELVRNNLHHWVDLIFGYQQTGENAVEAINVFHPATYSMFLKSDITDPIERKAVETMVRTYGQMPRQLFRAPHPATKSLNYCLADKQILQSVHGLRWGVYLGSPQLSKPTLGPIHKLPGADYLVSFNNTNVIYGLPSKSCVMQGAETDTYNVISWGHEDRIVRIQPLSKLYAKPKCLLHNGAFDDITACGSDSNSNQLWFGHTSGLISVYKCSSAELTNRSTKSRQRVRGLLSYNSALRKIATKAGGVKSETDGETTSTSHLTNSVTSSSETLSRDSADLCWSGPTVLMRHTDEITCISLSVEFKIAVSAGRDGIAVIWDLNDWSYVRTIERPAEIHHSPISLVAISPTLGDIVTVHTITWHKPGQPGSKAADEDQQDPSSSTCAQPAADECFEVTEENLDDFVNVSINPNGKSILRLHTVNARYVQHIVHEERILVVCYSYIKEGVGVNVIATAVEGGIVRLWSSWNLSFVSEIVTGVTNIKSLTYSTHQHLVVLTKESYIQVWETDGLHGSSPKFPQIAYK